MLSLKGMTLGEKIGQLLMVGFQGTDLNGNAQQLIQKLSVGGIILFGRNVSTSPGELSRLCKDLQDTALGGRCSLPLFIAVDQEGGRVARLQPPYIVPPAAARLGETHSAEEVYSWYARVAKELKEVGINMNLAPVLDIHTNPTNPIIGDRSFGSDPVWVSHLGRAAIRALQDHGILAVGKHFPGHGDTHLDSHLALPWVDHSEERLKEVELKPFQGAIAEGVSGIMTAHVVYTCLDSSYPATLSPRIVKGLLRRELGFSGLVLSDDLEMKAIERHYSLEKAAVLAIKAGVDLLLVCHSSEKQERVYQGLLKAVEEGEISLGELDEAITRVLAAKEIV